MPNPKGSRLLYVPPHIMENFPELNSGVLQTVLQNIEIWTKYLKLSADWDEFESNEQNTLIVDALKKMRIV